MKNKKQPTKTPYWIYNETYRIGFYFCAGFTEDELAEAINQTIKYECTPTDREYIRCHDGFLWEIENTKDRLSGTFIWSRYAEMNSQTMDTIVHEAWHLVSSIFKKVGLKHDLDNDEAGAYLIGWIVRKCMQCIEQEK